LSHNLVGKQSVTLDTYNGLVTLADSVDLPEGASPRNWDVDFNVGSVKTRSGLTSAFNFSSFAMGNPQSAVSKTPVIQPWQSPGNILLNTPGSYATTVSAPETVVAPYIPSTIHDITGSNTPWTNVDNLVSTSSFATNTFSVGPFSDVVSLTGNLPTVPSTAKITGVSISVNSAGIDTYLTFSLEQSFAVDQSILTTNASSVQVLGSSSYLWGQTLTPANIAGMKVYLQAHRFAGSTTVSVNNIKITVYYTLPVDTYSDPLQVTDFFDIAPGTGITGLSAALTGYSNDAANLITGQLVYQGSVIPGSTAQALVLPYGTTPSAAGTVNFPSTFWGVNLGDINLNDPSFGIQIEALADGVVNLQFANLTALTAPGSFDINYLKTGEYELGSEDIQTLVLDSTGRLFADADLSGVLTQLSPSAIPFGSYAFSTSEDSREYICISDLVNGTYPPIQYVPQPNQSPNYWVDRVTQVGPGASPSFSNAPQGSTLSTGNQGAITAFSITSGVATFTVSTMSTPFPAGQIIRLSGLTSSYAVTNNMNGLIFNVQGSPAPTTTSFVVATTLPNTSGSVTDAGFATEQYSDPIKSITQYPIQTSTYGPFHNSGELTGMLWSAGPGTTDAGTTCTVFYWDAQQNPVGDQTLINTFNSGVPTYVYITGAPFGNGVQLVTSASSATQKGPGGEDNQFYFTFQMPTSGTQHQGFGAGPCPGEYQQTLATIKLAVPDPGLSVGDQVTISGAGTGWNNIFTIVSAVNSGSYGITATQVLANGVAEYTYVDQAGTTVPPIVGQLVTVTGTTNANLSLNVTDATITAVNTGAGTFQVSGLAVPVTSLDSEQGAATTAGDTFTIDPGAALVGSTSTSPIYTAATAGQLSVIGGTDQAIGIGTRQGVVMFLTRNGFLTKTSPPVTFTIPANANYIYATSIPIGPLNTVARVVAFTEAGSNGVAGGSFYYIPAPVQFTVGGRNVFSSSFIINDNVTTSTSFTFNDQTLLAATEIDIQGGNQFAQIELGAPAWNTSYAGRMFYGGCQAKLQNFLSLSFDGGYNNSTGASNLLPLGWSVPAAYNPATGAPLVITGYEILAGTPNTVIFTVPGNDLVVGQDVYVQDITVVTELNNLIYTVTAVSSSTFTADVTFSPVSPTVDTGQATPINEGGTLLNSQIFGNSWFIKNTTGQTSSALGMLTQSAYQDSYLQPILQTNTLYSVRITARCATGSSSGALVVDLTSQTAPGPNPVAQFGQTYGSIMQGPLTGWQLDNMGTSFTTETFQFLTPPNGAQAMSFTDTTSGVPSNLLLRLFALNIPNGVSVEIDSIEIFPTQNPVDSTKVYASYINNPEAFDGDTGVMGLDLNNAQPVNGAAVLYDILYLLKSNSMFSTQDSEGSEPSQWDIRQVSNRCGTIGPNSFDIGEQWIVTACRSGVYVFTGNQPQKINMEIPQIWEAINWEAGSSIWLKNDTTNRRLYVGIPLPTPNQWLPEAEENIQPAFPNVVLMCNYNAIQTGSELQDSSALHTTMFGTLNSVDMRRKWSIWQIPSPAAALLTQADGVSQVMTFGNGRSDSTVLALDPSTTSDNGIPVNGLYTTYGFVDAQKASQNPLLGFHRKRFNLFQALVTGYGTCKVRFLANSITAAAKNIWTIPGGLNLTANPDGAEDFEKPLNSIGQRVFVELSTNAVTDYMSISKLIMVGSKDAWASIRGNLV
jgi:hypothetical protein